MFSMLQSVFQGRFVSHQVEEWKSADGVPGRRDTITFVDPNDGQVLSCSPPRDGAAGLHPVVTAAMRLNFGDEVRADIEQRVYVAPGASRATTLFVLHDIRPAQPPAPTKS